MRADGRCLGTLAARPATVAGMQPEDRSQAATNKAIRRIADEFGVLSAAEVARLFGLSVAEMAELTATGGLLQVVVDGVPGYPSFQFGPDGQPLPIFVALGVIAGRHAYSPNDVVLWLCVCAGQEWFPVRSGVLPNWPAGLVSAGGCVGVDAEQVSELFLCGVLVGEHAVTCF